jgi:hypothetical protein
MRIRFSKAQQERPVSLPFGSDMPLGMADLLANLAASAADDWGSSICSVRYFIEQVASMPCVTLKKDATRSSDQTFCRSGVAYVPQYPVHCSQGHRLNIQMDCEHVSTIKPAACRPFSSRGRPCGAVIERSRYS